MFSTMSRGAGNQQLTVSQGANSNRQNREGSSLKSNVSPKNILELAKEGIVSKNVLFIQQTDHCIT